jgi:hypothetical protein
MKKLVQLALLGFMLATAAAVALTVTPQAIARPCDKNGCCSGEC